ncbi:hypothetical protein [Devosia sp.]|uniref:hypothetical protein n=1 Tax=Devosia sp. TaxID=1871048 RepID=UPI002FCB3FFD
MKAKILIAAFLVVLAATVPAIAQGNGDGGNAGQADDGNHGNGNGARTNSSDGDGNSVNAGRGSDPRGGNGDGNGAGASNKPPTPPDVSVVPEKDLLAIVNAGHAVSLASLLPNVQERTGGEIIDAQLVRTERALIYAVKVLTPDGRVGVEYYNARSGTHIEVR